MFAVLCAEQNTKDNCFAVFCGEGLLLETVHVHVYSYIMYI